MTDAYQRLASAQADAARAKAQLAASQPEYRRLKGLYRHQHNVSKKEVQNARAAWLSDQAAAHAAQAKRSSTLTAIQAQWGVKIAQWMRKDSPAFEQLIHPQHQHRLLKLTLPLGEAPANPPASAQVLAGGKAVAASLISPAPATDPDLQGRSYYFRASSQSELLSYGLHVTALMPYGPQHNGVVVPDAAVVWSQGSAWAYVAKGGGRFVRQPVRTDTPVPGGWFQASGLDPGSRLVTRGASILFSVQALANAPKGSAGGDEGDTD
ncbi:RND-type multidrug efflux pump, membrane permease [Salinisphaera sp. LB1]|nr:RND-type multidrug efflux pump, membrane permease [Salinisphaera sp. LB1]